MWIFTVDGFFSVVEDKNNPRRLLVRSRVKTDMQQLLGKLRHLKKSKDSNSNEGSLRMLFTPNYDYTYRSFVPKSLFGYYVLDAVLNLDYHNFKNKVHSNKCGRRNRAMMNIWSTVSEEMEDVDRAESRESR